MDTVGKSIRQSRIVDLIRREEIHTQKDLLVRLRKLGIDATQVTVSRDLHDLGIVKTLNGYQRISSGQPFSLEAIAREFMIAASPAQNLVVVRTTPGNAMTVAKALDNETWPEITGTIAGDDTVLVVAPEKQAAARIAQKLMRLK